MADVVFKKIELVGTSTKSLSDAAANAVAGSPDEPNLSWFEVVEQRGRIVDGKVHEFQVTVRLGARLE